MVTFIGNIRKANIRAESISKRKDGTVIIRRGFFYRNGYTAERFAEYIHKALATAGLSATIVDQGEIWKPFRGGGTVANSSHWFVALAEK